MNKSWKRLELLFLVLYALAFYVVIIRRSLHLSHEYYGRLRGLRQGWISNRLNDMSDAQWRNFRGNLVVLTAVFGIFSLVANTARTLYRLKGRGMSIVWLLISLSYLAYLHGACVIFILSISSVNFFLVKMFVRSPYFSAILWMFNILVLLVNRIYEGYSFSFFGQSWASLDNYRGTFRWHICFNFVILRMISFGCDYQWAHQVSHFNEKDKPANSDRFSFTMYLCYLVFAPLYIAGPIISFEVFALQLEMPQNKYSVIKIAWYGVRWLLSLLLMELMTHLFYYNAFAISGFWIQLSPWEVFIIGYGVLMFMWLKFFLIWRYFRFWSLIAGIDVPENMPRCINNCHNLETFWKNWHASFNKWLVRYIYIPLGGSRTKLVNVWIVFTFVAIWHDLEWKLLSWAWLTCLFFVPEMIVKSAVAVFQAKSASSAFIFRELSAIAGAITITCLMVANLVGYVIGPSGLHWLSSKLLQREGLPVLAGIFLTFYVGTKLMFHIRDVRQNCW
ncbi:membrane-bound O-acyltransferase gup1 isoform X2 [Aristolochia californica]|uniref:membrane-bound O-acyltransferase gup1 isoform X2 n=1 Tax=Aristolochia californica TaxID=171875 RepID=UPI0035E01D4D